MAQLSAFHSSTQLTKAAGRQTASSPARLSSRGPSRSFSTRVIVAATGFICEKASALAASSARCTDTTLSALSKLAALAPSRQRRNLRRHRPNGFSVNTPLSDAGGRNRSRTNRRSFTQENFPAPATVPDHREVDIALAAPSHVGYRRRRPSCNLTVIRFRTALFR